MAEVDPWAGIPPAHLEDYGNALNFGALPDDRPDDSINDALGYVDWEKAFSAQPANPPWIVRPFIMEARTHALWGEPGEGKSLFILETVVNHIITDNRIVLYIDNENIIDEIVDRLTSFGMKPASLKNLRFRTFQELPPLNTMAGGLEVTRMAKEECDAAVVVIDTTSRFIEGEENNSTPFLDFYRHTLMPLKKHKIASVRLDHPGKDLSKGTRGSSAKFGDIDFEWKITDQGLTRTLTLTKNRTRYGLKKGGTIILRCHGVTENNPYFFHEWDYHPEVTAADKQLADDVRVLESLGLPADSGRRTVSKALAGKGYHIGTDRLAAALRVWKGSDESCDGSEQLEM